MKYTEQADAERVAHELRQGNDYLAVRVLPDNSVAAILDLITTRAIILGCTSWGWTTRFCFADRALADQRFKELETEDDEPDGCVARRG